MFRYRTLLSNQGYGPQSDKMALMNTLLSCCVEAHATCWNVPRMMARDEADKTSIQWGNRLQISENAFHSFSIQNIQKMYKHMSTVRYITLMHGMTTYCIWLITHIVQNTYITVFVCKTDTHIYMWHYNKIINLNHFRSQWF